MYKNPRIAIVDTAQRGITVRKTLIILLAAVMVMSVGLFVFRPKGSHQSASSADYQKVGDQFVGDITSKKAQEAYNLMAPELQQRRPQDDWQAILSDDFSSYTGKAELFGTFKVAGSSSAYQLRYRLRSADSSYVIYLLVSKDGNAWKVSDLETNTPPPSITP